MVSASLAYSSDPGPVQHQNAARGLPKVFQYPEASIGRPAEQVPRQFHHVVGAAALRGARPEFGRELARIGIPRLAIAGASRAIGALADHFIPEVFGDVAITVFARELVISRRGDHLRNVRIYVQAFEFVAMGGERIEELLLVEALRAFEVVLLAGHRVEIAEDFAHASELGAEHALPVFVAEGLSIAIDPGRHFMDHLESLLVAAMLVHVQQTGHDLVDGVEGSPDLLTLAQSVEKLHGEGAQVATLQLGLAFSESGDHGGSVVLQVFISAGGIHQRARRKIVATGVVAAEFAVGGLPSSERLR